MKRVTGGAILADGFPERCKKSYREQQECRNSRIQQESDCPALCCQGLSGFNRLPDLPRVIGPGGERMREEKDVLRPANAQDRLLESDAQGCNGKSRSGKR